MWSLCGTGGLSTLGNERIEDVTTHPAFRNAVRTVARLYDMKADPAQRETMTYEEDGDRHSIYYLRPQTRDDLQRRMLGHRTIADLTYGLFGRLPDHVASFVTGMAMKVDELTPPTASRTICSPTTGTSVIMTSTPSTPCYRPKLPGIQRFTNSATCRCPPSASCARRTMAS